jgi:tetratricopeptide (TPR) repeat protein
MTQAELTNALEHAKRARQAGKADQAQLVYCQLLNHHAEDTEAWMRLAEFCQQRGELSEAEANYQQALRTRPKSVDCLIRLGVVLLDQNKVEEGITRLEQAAILEPKRADAHYYLANAWSTRGRPERALVAYQRVIEIQPDHTDALTNQGITLARLGRVEEAVARLRQAIQARPDFAKAHHNLGVALAELRKFDEAAASLNEALRLNPDYAEAYYNLGNILGEQRKHREAVENYKRAIALNPDYVDALNNLGLALKEMGRFGEAVVVLRQAARLRPSQKETWNNLGLALVELHRFEEAEKCYHEGLALDPRFVDAHTNLGSMYKDQERAEEALGAYQQALWLEPQNASAHWNRSLALLQVGDYEEGWREYQWRWKRKGSKVRSFSQPVWDGTPCPDATILLHMEQGLGDMIQFIRYARLVRPHCGRVVVECPRFLVPLFSSAAGIDQLVAEGDSLPAFDFYAPLLDLPCVMGTRLNTIPAEVPYLHIQAELIEGWCQRLAGFGTGFKVGLAWQGNVHHGWDRSRSVKLNQFAALGRVDGVHFYSLQKREGAQQAESCQFQVTDFGEELDRDHGAFMDTAAIMKSLDLVITVDTAIVHLAGALGTPTWLALSTRTDWRWLRGRNDSPWYPTLRLYRQSSPAVWNDVFDRMACDLEGLLRNRKRQRNVAVAKSKRTDAPSASGSDHST